MHITIWKRFQAENTKVRIWCREISRPEYSYGLTYEEAAEKSGVCSSIVKQICLGTYNKPYAKGWTFAKDEITLFNNCTHAFKDIAKGVYDIQNQGRFKKGHRPSNKVSREIIELDNENNIIAEFESIKQLSEILNIPATILGGILNRNTTTKSTQFRIFKYKTDRPKRKTTNAENKNHSTKPVDQYDLNGNFIKHYNSIKEAAEYTNLTPVTIRRICKEVTKTPKCGFFFKYST